MALKVLILGHPYSGKTTIKQEMRSRGHAFPIHELDEEFSVENGGEWPDDYYYRKRIILPKVFKKILSMPEVVFFTSEFEIEHIKEAKAKGFFVIQFYLYKSQLARRINYQQKARNYSLKLNYQDQKLVKRLGLVDKRVNSFGSPKKVADELEEILGIGNINGDVEGHTMQPNEHVLHVHVVRHGKSLYGQREVTSVEEANDLTPEAPAEIEANAQEFAQQIGQDDGEVEIWSSPYGRTLQTARIYWESLCEAGVRFHKNHEGKCPIKIFRAIDEHRYYPVDVVHALEAGGKVFFQGHAFTVDKKKTNPRNLDPVEYFFQHEIEKIPEKVKTKWPKEYQKVVAQLENVYQVTERMMRPLARLREVKDKNYRFIIVTHNRLMGFLAYIFTGGKRLEVEPGEMINLKRENGKLVVTSMSNYGSQGDSQVDVIDEFDRLKKHQTRVRSLR